MSEEKRSRNLMRQRQRKRETTPKRAERPKKTAAMTLAKLLREEED